MTFNLSVKFVRQAFHLWFLLIFYVDRYRRQIFLPRFHSQQIILNMHLISDRISSSCGIQPLYIYEPQNVWNHRKKQEAHGPRLAHLSVITTADMQMLCNIFPIQSSQPMKRSSFEQFLVLKKNIWAWQSMEHNHLNKLSITFQQ